MTRKACTSRDLERLTPQNSKVGWCLPNSMVRTSWSAQQNRGHIRFVILSRPRGEGSSDDTSALVDAGSNVALLYVNRVRGRMHTGKRLLKA